MRFAPTLDGMDDEPPSTRPTARAQSGSHPLPPPDRLPSPSRLPGRSGLPDPFVTFGGDPVETTADWRERRAEILALFRRYVYGYAPAPPAIETTTERTAGVLDGAATLVEVTIEFADLPADAPSIRLAVFVPSGADADTPVPAVLALNRAGNHAVVPDEAVTVADAADRFGADERGAETDFWCVERVVERGYAFATYHCADVDPDRDDFGDGVHPSYDDALPGPPEAAWGSLAAWAWGLSRCVDALESVDVVRDDQIAVTGHSRAGKAALWAGASDERIALVAPHQSGTGGCALSRDNGQETVHRITGAYPHWFADALASFGGRVDRLPVDQHLLVACVAPRPLIDTEGGRDYWANPGRALDALRAAAPVWEFLDADGLAGDGLLSGADEITPDAAGDLLQFRRETEHTFDRGYWDAILDFADCHFE